MRGEGGWGRGGSEGEGVKVGRGGMKVRGQWRRGKGGDLGGVEM